MTRNKQPKSVIRAAVLPFLAALTLATVACESAESTGKPVSKRGSVSKQSVTKQAPKWESRPSAESP